MKIENHPDNTQGLPFIAYVPEKLSDNPALIVHLHGVGERGDGGDELERVKVHGLPNVVNDGNLKDCVMVCPQCPSNTFWVAKIETIKKFIDSIVDKYSIDKNRIYLCGLSMGGYGTWYTAQAYPDFFAAIAPCCGGGMVWYSAILKMPVWAFHGEDDDSVDVSETLNMIKHMQKYHRNVRYDIYKGVGHNAWDYGFTDDLLEWFYKQHK